VGAGGTIGLVLGGIVLRIESDTGILLLSIRV